MTRGNLDLISYHKGGQDPDTKAADGPELRMFFSKFRLLVAGSAHSQKIVLDHLLVHPRAIVQNAQGFRAIVPANLDPTLFPAPPAIVVKILESNRVNRVLNQLS